MVCHRPWRRAARLRAIVGLLALALCLGGLSACSKRYDDVPAYSPIALREYENEGVGRFKTSYLADQIDQYYRGSTVGPIGVTTFVNLDDLYTTSTFGRVYAEQLISELAMRGFDVIELRHSDALQFLGSAGEFALSRDVAAVKPSRELSGVVVGTYIASPVRVYVNARLIDPTTSLVLSAASVEMGKSNEIGRLLRGNSLPPTLERIPVKHLGLSTYPLQWAERRRQWRQEEEDPYYLAPAPRAPRAQPAPKPETLVEPKLPAVTEGAAPKAGH